jgi:uncharacterized membrane protein YfcA
MTELAGVPVTDPSGLMTVGLAVLAGLGIGLALGALGGGGSILAVPVLVYLLGQTPAQATTGSLVVVGITSAISAYTAWRAGTVLPARGVAFGLVAIGGATLGALASSRVPDAVLMVAFALLVAVVAAVMTVRQVQRARRPEAAHPAAARTRPRFDDPIITLSPTFVCRCPRALKVLVTATVVGLLTGFLGVGGGFLVVPALVLALALPMNYAAGTSLVAITITSATALTVRAGTGPTPDWTLVAILTIAAVAGGWLGAHLARRLSTQRLQAAFTTLLVAVGVYTASQALPALT